MLEFNSKAVIIIPEDELKGMFDATVNGATQHAGDGASAAKLLNRINTLMMPYMLLGIPGQSYIVANLRQVAAMPPGQLIQMMNQNRSQQSGPMNGNLPPIITSK